MKTFKDILSEARMAVSADFRITKSGRKVHKMKKIADDDYHKEKDLDNDGDNDAQDKKLAKESVTPPHMQGKQKPYVSSDGKGNYEVLGNRGHTKATFTRAEHGKDAHAKAQAHLRSKYNEYMKEEVEELDEVLDMRHHTTGTGSIHVSHTHTSPSRVHSIGYTDAHKISNLKAGEKHEYKNANGHEKFTAHKQTDGSTKIHDDRGTHVATIKNKMGRYDGQVKEARSMMHHHETQFFTVHDKDGKLHSSHGAQRERAIQTAKEIGGKAYRVHGNGYSWKHDHIKEAVDKQEQRLVQLARLGLVDKSDVAKLRIAMDQLKADKVLTLQQRTLLLSVLNDLVDLVTGDDTVFQRVKMDLQKEETEIIEEESVLVEYDSVNGRYVHKAKPGNYGGSDRVQVSADKVKNPTAKDLKDIESKKKVKEEVEQIDEISKKTLGSYVKKASTDVGHKVATAAHGSHSAKELDARGHKDWANDEYDRSNSNYKKAQSRVSGIAKATDRLTKEEVELEEGGFKRIATDKEEDDRLAKQGSWKKETPWMKSKGDVTDKSGAKHTAMSAAKHLARLALKKQQAKSK